MAMTKCRECDELVSSRAKSCPYCGAQDPGTRWPRLKRVLAISLLVVAALALVAMILPPPALEKQAETVPLEMDTPSGPDAGVAR